MMKSLLSFSRFICSLSVRDLSGFHSIPTQKYFPGELYPFNRETRQENIMIKYITNFVFLQVIFLSYFTYFLHFQIILPKKPDFCLIFP